jgi:tetratricopeptide (TPR) repeat protein
MVGDTTGADAAMAHSANRAAALDFPQGPWSAAYGAWLGSWMLAERGAFDRAAADVAQMIESSAEHGFDSWTMIGMTHQAAIETMRSLHDRDAGAQVWMQHATTLGEMVALWKSLELLLFLPFYLTVQGAAFAAAGEVDAAATAYQEAVELGERTGMRFYIAETMRRSAQLDRDADQTVGQLWKALALARAQSARPFELRIAADLVEIGGADAVPALEAAVAAMAPGTRSVDLDAARTRIAHS